MKVKPTRVTEYMICVAEKPAALHAFSNLVSFESNGELLCITLNNSYSRLQAEAARYRRAHMTHVGILAAPSRFSRPRNLAIRAYQAAVNLYPYGCVLSYDALVNHGKI